MNNVIYKTNNKMRGERLQVKTFKTSQGKHIFLNKQTDNEWHERPTVFGGLTSPTKRGTYARAGGGWHNVKSLDVSVLAHI
jgi:hypothetical protein